MCGITPGSPTASSSTSQTPNNVALVASCTRGSEAKLNGQARLARPAGTNERDQVLVRQGTGVRSTSSASRPIHAVNGVGRFVGSVAPRTGARGSAWGREVDELERCALVTLEAERRDQAVGTVRVRATVTPLEVLNRAQAQSSALSKVFLRQARGKSVRA